MEDKEFEGLLDHLRALHGMPSCFNPNDDPGLVEGITKIHDDYHATDPPKANFGKTAPRHDADYFGAP